MSLLIVLACVVPLLALGVLWLFWRWRATHTLAPALLGCGLGGAFLTGLFTFTRITMPIARYESDAGVITQVIWALLLAIWVGFGLGILLGSPILLIVGLVRSRQAKQPAG